MTAFSIRIEIACRIVREEAKVRGWWQENIEGTDLAVYASKLPVNRVRYKLIEPFGENQGHEIASTVMAEFTTLVSARWKEKVK